MDHVATRVAMNQARFREANEEIEPRAVIAGVETVPFICRVRRPELHEVNPRQHPRVRDGSCRVGAVLERAWS